MLLKLNVIQNLSKWRQNVEKTCYDLINISSHKYNACCAFAILLLFVEMSSELRLALWHAFYRTSQTYLRILKVNLETEQGISRAKC